MKKFLLRIFVCGIAATLLLTLTACNSDENPSTASSSPVVSAAEEGTSSEEEQDSGASQTGATGKYETIAAFLESDEMQQQLESVKSSLEGQDLNVSVTAEDNKLIYAYTYTVDIDTATAATLLEEGVKEQSSVFETVVSSLKLAVDVENPIVVVTYLDKDGNEIYTAEFTEDGMTGQSGTEAEDPSNEESTGKFKTIADFVASDEMQQQLESIKSAAEGQNMDITITGEGDKLVYTYTFAEGTDTTGAADILKEGLDAQAETFQSVASTLKLVVDVENPIVVVTYLDSDGTVIYSAEFTAD